MRPQESKGFLMGKMSREKGKRFERFLAGYFKDYGYDAHRSAQFRGNTGQAADVEGIPGIHCEAKHQERMQLYDWMQQAVSDAEKAGDGKPTVFHKQNGKDVLVTMRLDDWMDLYREWESSKWLKKECSQ